MPIPILLTACASVPGNGPTIVSGDFDGDGRSDEATLGARPNLLTVTVHRGLANPQALEFGVGTGAQDAVCVLPVIMSASAASCEADGDVLPGCVEIPGKMDLTIIDGACADIHLYWDQAHQRMAWWRR